MKIVTCIAPVNIAVIKYWGKRDEELILPINDSLSATLSTDHMCSKTTIMASPDFPTNRFWLNGTEETFTNPRLNNCLNEVRKQVDPNSPLLQWKLHICSENNFPTAAGLASSAAGYACLVYTLAHLYNIQGDISRIARRGSGSACRSVLGGWVQWHRGLLPSGEDSIASQVAPPCHWPQIRVIVLVVNSDRKKCSSTSGMQRSVQTSQLLKHRAAEIVPKRVEEIIRSITNRDFDSFAKITMQDSNQFHAVCLDTFPPCVYLNDVSHCIIEMVHAYNNYHGSNKVAYTFDAGPNACLYLLDAQMEEFLGVIQEVFPQDSTSDDYLRGEIIIPAETNLLETLNLLKQLPGCLKYIIKTRVGEGPQVLVDHAHHLLSEDGLLKVA